MVMVKVRMDPTTDQNNRWCYADIYRRHHDKLDNANLHENAWNREENNRGTHWAEILLGCHHGACPFIFIDY